MATVAVGRVFARGVRAVLVQNTTVHRITQKIRCLSISHRLLSERRYTERHEWILKAGTIGTVGITDYAQDKLGELVYVSLPEIGATLHKDEEAAELESVKAAAEVYTPAAGTVKEVNSELSNNPNKINTSPFDEGWMFKLDLSAPNEVDELMDEEAYKKFTESEHH